MGCEGMSGLLPCNLARPWLHLCWAHVALCADCTFTCCCPIRERNRAAFVLFSTSSLRYVCFADETSPNATVRANAESTSEWRGTGWVGKKVLGFVAALSHFGDHDIELEVGEGVPTLADRPSTFHHCQGGRQCPYRLMCVSNPVIFSTIYTTGFARAGEQLLLCVSLFLHPVIVAPFSSPPLPPLLRSCSVHPS